MFGKKKKVYSVDECKQVQKMLRKEGRKTRHADAKLARAVAKQTKK